MASTVGGAGGGRLKGCDLAYGRTNVKLGNQTGKR